MNPSRPDLPSTGFLRLPQVLALIPISRSAWWAGIRAGKYPAGRKLGGKTTVWRAEDIRALIPQCQHSCRILLKAIFIDESLQPCRKTRSRAQDIAP